MLYIVPTPIGNIEDITLRAIKVLKECDLILAEDTRTSNKLLKHYEIATPLRSYHAFNEHKITGEIIDILESGQDIALVSDAGTPGISDPGFLLVRSAIERNVEITCLPGASAIIPAAVVSGLPCDKFHFEGFLPHKKGRKTRWEYLAQLPVTFILYESPHRINKCVQEIASYCGHDRRCTIVREISKIYEEVLRGTAAQLAEDLKTKKLKGEIVVIVQGVA